MTVAGMFGPRGLLAVFPSLLSFYERIGMDDEHQQNTHVLYIHTDGITRKLLLLACMCCKGTQAHTDEKS